MEKTMVKELKYLGLMEQLITKTMDIQYERAQEDNFIDMKEKDIKEHAENVTKMIELEHNISKMLSPEGKKMFFELDCLQGTNLAMESHYMFKRGVVDGLTSIKYLKDAGDCVYLPSIKL